MPEAPQYGRGAAAGRPVDPTVRPRRRPSAEAILTTGIVVAAGLFILLQL